MRRTSILLSLLLLSVNGTPGLSYPPNWVRLLRIEKPIVKSGNWIRLWASAGGYYGAEMPDLSMSSDQGETWGSLLIGPASVVKREVPGPDPQRFTEVSLLFRAPTEVGYYLIKATSKAPSGGKIVDEDLIVFSIEDPSASPHKLTLKTLDSTGKSISTYVKAKIPMFGQSYTCYYDGSLTRHVILTYAERADIDVYLPPFPAPKVSKEIIVTSENKPIVVKLPPFAQELIAERTPPFLEYLDKSSLPQERFNTGTTAYINGHRLLECYTNPASLEDNFSRTTVTIESDGIYSLCRFAEIKLIERLKSGRVRVDLRNGQSILGNWIPNDRTSNFYRDSGNPLETGYIYGLNTYWYGWSYDNPSRVKIDNIARIWFHQSPKGESNEVKHRQLYPKTIELKDGRMFTTGLAFAIDYCGHSWSSTYHATLQDHCMTVMNSGRKVIFMKELAEIAFTGEFDDKQPQCREILLKYQDGKEQRGSLLLMSESYGGVCNCRSRFRHFDKMLVLQNFGAVLIPLDKVVRIIPISVAPER